LSEHCLLAEDSKKEKKILMSTSLRGTSNPASKANWNVIRTIRAAKNSHLTGNEIRDLVSAKYGVALSKSTINRIRAGNLWTAR
jgi:hypothetical protein